MFILLFFQREPLCYRQISLGMMDGALSGIHGTAACISSSSALPVLPPGDGALPIAQLSSSSMWGGPLLNNCVYFVRRAINSIIHTSFLFHSTSHTHLTPPDNHRVIFWLWRKLDLPLCMSIMNRETLTAFKVVIGTTHSIDQKNVTAVPRETQFSQHNLS